MLRRVGWTVVATAILVASGCNGRTPPQDPKSRYRGVTIKVVVPALPELVAWLGDQRGEWTAQTGAQVELVSREAAADSRDAGDSTSGSFMRNRGPNGDILIYPTRELGAVIVSGSVVKLPQDVFDSPAFERKDLTPAVHDQLIAWDRQPHAVPISAEAMLVYFRADLFADDGVRDRFEQKFGRALRPPATWGEFDDLAEFFDGQDLDGDGFADSSVAISSAGEALVCRAAAYGKLPKNFSFYFDVNTFEPLVAGPAFQQAADDWRRIARFVAGGGTPDPSLDTLAAGRAALGVGSSAIAARLLATDSAASIGCAPLPGSTRAFQHDKRNWIELPAETPNRAAVVQGLVASVLDSCSQPLAAFDFLTFLSSRERSLVPVTTPGNRLGAYRLSHLVDPFAWTSAGWSAAGTPSFVSALGDSYVEPNVIASLRILGADEFIRTLDEHATASLRGDSPPDAALQRAAESWREIAERLGNDRLRRQYRYSLGIPVVK